MRALLLIDHGSRVPEANASLEGLARLVDAALRTRGDTTTPVGFAHMELAAPTVEDAMAGLRARGASHVTAVPCMLTAGKHATVDIPNLVRAAAGELGLSFDVAPPLGVHALLAELVLHRAGR